MRWAIIIGFCFGYLASLAQQMEDVREQFHTINNEVQLLAFIELTSELNDDKATPYKEAASMRLAEFTANPFKKLKYFNQGKKRLELYINQNPFNIEARYVRALIQSEVPVFLNYNEQFDSDASFILENIDTCRLPFDYKEKIKDTINQLVKNH